MRRPDPFNREIASIEVDWIGALPALHLACFQSYARETETRYIMFSVMLDEAITLRNQSLEKQSIESTALAAILCDRLGNSLETIFAAMADHCKNHHTVPAVVPLDPEFFSCPRARRMARERRLLGRFIPKPSRFLFTIASLRQVATHSSSDFHNASVRLDSVDDQPPAAESWAAMDAAHYDLNTCFRESLVMLKCFLRVLPAEQLALFQWAAVERKQEQGRSLPSDGAATRANQARSKH